MEKQVPETREQTIAQQHLKFILLYSPDNPVMLVKAHFCIEALWRWLNTPLT